MLTKKRDSDTVPLRVPAGQHRMRKVVKDCYEKNCTESEIVFIYLFGIQLFPSKTFTLGGGLFFFFFYKHPGE